jgi:hypothetical protein
MPREPDAVDSAGGQLPGPHPEIGAAAGGTAVIRDLVAVVLAHLPRLVDQLVGIVHDAENAYRRGGTIPDADMRRSFHDNMAGVLRVFAGTAPDGADPADVPRETGRRRAEQGVPLECVLHVYRLGSQLLWEALLAEARSRPPDVLEHLIDRASLLWGVVDRYSVAFADGYRAREAEASRGDARRREAVLDALLDGRGADPAVAAEAQAVLGLPEHGRYVVVTLVADAAAGEPPRAPRDALGAHGIGSGWRLRGEAEIGVVELGRAPLRRVVALLRTGPHVRAGVSSEVRGLAEIGTAYRLAETALCTLPEGAAGVAVLDERLPEALVVSSPQIAQRLAHGTLARVLDLDSAERDVLLDTLEVWFGCERSAGRAAQALHCHRNTVLNRLRRIEKLTGRSLEDDRHQLACRLALVALRTLPSADEPADHLRLATS